MICPDLCLDLRQYALLARPGHAHGDVERARRSLGLGRGQCFQAALARKEFETALSLRETIHRLFDAQAQGKPPAARDLDTLNAALASRARHARHWKRGREGYEWDVEA